MHSAVNRESFYLRYQEWMLFLTRCSIIILLYGVSASMALASIGAVFTLAFWILTFDWIRPWPRLIKLPAFWPLILVPAMVIFGTLYSTAPFDYAIRYFGVYSRFLIILIIISVIDDEVWQKRCWTGFFIGAAVTLFSTYLSIFYVLPWSKSQSTGLGENHSVFYDYIAQGVMTSFLAIVALSNLLTEKLISFKFLWLSVLFISVFGITHLLIGRTGQIVCVIGLLSVVITAHSIRRSLIIIGALMIFIIILWISSPVISQRFMLILSEITAYQQGVEMTSIGARLAMWKVSWIFFWDQPIFGHGTGSYRLLSESVFTDTVMCKISCIHPHNQFLFFGVEHGIIGIFIYGWLFFALFKIANQVDLKNKLILTGLVAIIFVDSFINSPFWISSERNFYTSVMALAMTSFYLNRAIKRLN